jgi:enoyl reductase-like protein
MKWTTPSKPIEGISYYDHVILETPIGKAIIEWKSWKERESYDIYIDGSYLGCDYELDKAKEVVHDYLKNKFNMLQLFINTEQPIKETTKEDLLKSKMVLTVGDIKKHIEKYNLSDDTIVLLERIEDRYFENHGWSVYLKEGDSTITDKNGCIIKDTMVQYHTAHCCVLYNDDKEFLFIDSHY